MVVPALKKHKDKLIKKEIHIRFTENDFQELKQFCYERNITMSDFIRGLIKNAIKRTKK